MPIVIKTGNIKYKNNDGQYVGINSVAETTTAQQVAAIQSEGAAQIAAIDTKATEAEASLSSVGELEDIIAEVFNSSTPYSEGQYVIQAVEENSNIVNKLFKFIDDHNGPWLDEDVEEVRISNELSNKADCNKYYDNMSVGTADQLLSENYIEDNTPYLLRQSGGDLDTGNREKLDSIVGGTVCWNQLVTFTNGDVTSERITYTKANGMVTANGTASGSSYINLGSTIHGINDHVILIIGGAAGGSSSTYYLRDGYTSQKYDLGNGLMLKKTNDNLIPQIAIASGVSVSNLVFKPQFFDLTQMFGFAIADYVYGLEQTTAGAGVAWFKALFPNDYYAYNAGELIGVKPSAHIMTDSNNASWSYPFNSNLELYGFLKLGANNKLYYDGDIYTNSGRITRKYGIVNLGSLNWSRHTDAGTNAFFQATASNRLYGTNSIILCTGFNSIIHSSSRYGFTRQEFGNEAADNSIGGLYANDNIVVRADSYTTKDSFTTAVNNIYILYELETQLTDEAKPFQELQIVDPNGTEEFIDTRTVPLPVGHKTKYYTDLKAKLEPIPSIITDDFSADRDYSEGDYCWYNNILYRFTEDHPHGAWSYGDTIASLLGEDISILRNEVRHPDATLTQTGNAADAKATGDKLFGAIDSLAEEFSTGRDYNEDEYCLYDNRVYRFTQDHPHGAWNYAHTIASPLGDDIYIMGGRVSTAEDDIGELKSAIGFSRITPYSSPQGYRLKTDGNCVNNILYTLIKYKVSAGQKVFVIGTNGGLENDRVLQFQDRETVATSGNESHVVGTAKDGSYTGYLTVPQGATYLIISALKTDISAGVYTFNTDELFEYESILKHVAVGKNIIGIETNIYYPVFIPAGKNVTWTHQDGTALIANSFYVYFYDKNKTQLSYYGAISNVGPTYRTVTPSNTTDVYYIKLTTSGEFNIETHGLQIEIGDTATAYEPYMPNPKRLNDVVREIEGNIQNIQGDITNIEDEIDVDRKKIAVCGCTGTKFQVGANSTHSSNNDQISVNIASGEYFWILCYGLNERNTGLYVIDADGNSALIGAASDRKPVCMRTDRDTVKMGLYVGSGSEATEVTFIIIKDRTAFASVIEDKDQQYKVKLSNAKRKANAGNYANLTSPEIFTIAHFSDIHGSSLAMKEVQRFKNVFGAMLDDVICTGDIVNDKISDGTDFWDNNSDGSILICIGNHDSYQNQGWDHPANQETLYDTFISPYEDNWDAETVEDHSYWYKDYAEKKIRLIALDGTILDSTEQAAQMTWFASALSGAKISGYSVIGAIHFPPVSSNFTKINSNFSALLHGTAGDLSQYAWSSNNTDILDAVDTFISDGGDFVCWLGGHTHWDIVSYDSRYPKQLFITVSCATPSSTFEERTRTIADGSVLVLNTICVDTVRKYVKLLRYGAEWDDCLRHQGTCVIKYDANPPTVIFEN